MAKHRLKLHDFNQEYSLLAIHSNAEIFKVAHSLNDLLKISLKEKMIYILKILIINFPYINMFRPNTNQKCSFFQTSHKIQINLILRQLCLMN